MARLSRLTLAMFLLHFSFLAFGQEKESADSLVRLVEARSAQLIEQMGVSYRKITGPATFLHNGTYLKCDTALWNVQTNIIDAIGNVQIIQENTFLTGDKIEYVVDENMAKCRGRLIELFDKDGNVLNTNYLDYNTKDSIALFFGGASLKSKDGQVIESQDGEYVAAQKRFTFNNQVQMFTDSVFISTIVLDYMTETDIAYFGPGTLAWKDENLLGASSGNFNRRTNVFTLDKDAYILTRDQELWADRLYYYKNTDYADLYDNIQVLDTLQSAISMADKATYRPHPMVVELSHRPVVGMYTLEDGVADTLFLAADTIRYYTRRMCDIDSSEFARAAERIKLSEIDPFAEHDRQREAAGGKELRMGAMEMMGLDENGSPQRMELPEKDPEEDSGMSGTADSLARSIGKDSLAVMGDSFPAGAGSPAVKDTSEVVFLDAWHHVKFHRSDIQGLCDSLVYTGIDSMARFYVRPVMWNEGKNQFAADSIQAVIRNRALHKVNMLSNAFITTREDSVHFNQIKSTEMAAFFTNNQVCRFDALGGASAILYIEEDSTITLMNEKESKMLSSKLKDNRIQRTRYIDDLKQNIYPVYNLPIDKQRLRGFEWRGDERPVTRFEVTPRKVRKTRRREMEQEQIPDFPFTGRYFPQQHSVLMEHKALMEEKKELSRMRKPDKQNGL